MMKEKIRRLVPLLKKGILIEDLLKSRVIESEEYDKDFLNKIKSFVKKNNWLYELAIDILSPVYSLNHRKELKTFINQQLENKDAVILNLGSGNSNIHKDVINIDMFHYDNVDFTADITELPFEDNSIDAVINIAVLEHVPYPQKVVKEIFRVLKPEGKVFSSIPFIQGFHASPYDYQRYTSEGIKVLHEQFKQIRVFNCGGPTSGFLWITQEWLAIVLSFGIKKLHLIIHLLLMILTFPLKFLDAILQYFPSGSNISTAFTYIGIKTTIKDKKNINV